MQYTEEICLENAGKPNYAKTNYSAYAAVSRPMKKILHNEAHTNNKGIRVQETC